MKELIFYETSDSKRFEQSDLAKQHEHILNSIDFLTNQLSSRLVDFIIKVGRIENNINDNEDIKPSAKEKIIIDKINKRIVDELTEILIDYTNNFENNFRSYLTKESPKNVSIL